MHRRASPDHVPNLQRACALYRPSNAQSNAAKGGQDLVASALVELWRGNLAIRLGLRTAHEEAFLDDLTVPDRVKPDLIEVHALLALGRDL